MFPKIAIWVLKNAEFDADFESSETVVKNLDEKGINEKVTEKLTFFYFYYCVQKVLTDNFLDDIFALFSMDGNSASIFAFYDTRIEFLRKKSSFSTFAYLKAKIGRTGSKNREKFFINVFHNPILHLSPVWAAPFCKKSLNRCTLMNIQVHEQRKNRRNK
jgi:hypothetical protein